MTETEGFISKTITNNRKTNIGFADNAVEVLGTRRTGHKRHVQ